MVSGNPTDSNAWYLLGLEYAQQKNIGEAIRAYSEALKYCDDTMKSDIINALSSLSTISGADKAAEQQDDPAFQDSAR
jgi:cytochrome c-type biogenesis protein CcmH/NrfG